MIKKWGLPSVPIREEKNKVPIRAANQLASRSIPSLVLSILSPLEPNTGSVTGKGTPHSVFYKMGPLIAHISSCFYRFTVTSNLEVFLTTALKLWKSVSGHSLYKRLCFSQNQEVRDQSLFWPFSKAKWSGGRAQWKNERKKRRERKRRDRSNWEKEKTNRWWKMC